jgi:hypothetical protein
VAGLALGAVGGWYGLAAGFLIGAMVDAARGSRRHRSYLHRPEGPKPEEAFEGMAAMAALASAPWWPGPDDPDVRRDLLVSVARESLPGQALALRGLPRCLEAAAAESGLPFDALARDLSLRGSDSAHRILARWAYALAKEGDRKLSHGAAASIVAALADSGCPAGLIAEARGVAFPDYRDPWDLLGVGPGATADEIKKAWRSRSRKLHPDHAGGEAAEAFREAKEAWDYLKSLAAADSEAGRGAASKP